jgi:hypothetical protein
MELKKVGLGIDWIDVAQDTDRWTAFDNAAVKHGVP